MAAELVCPNCFRGFPPQRLRFRCLEHDRPLVFESDERFRRPPTYAACPRGGHLCGIRLCPLCRATLPYHIGRAASRTVAVVGPRAAGKTLYMWALLHELRGRLAADPDPFAAAMFENDASYETFFRAEEDLFVHGRLPAATQAKGQEKGDLPPTTVRLWRDGRLTTLSLYDPAGELVENLQKIEFLSYLRHAAAIIYLVPPPDPLAREESLNAGAGGLANAIVYLRAALRLAPNRRIPKPLAVVLTQADESVFRAFPPSEVTPGYGRTADDWRRARAGRADRAAATTSDACREVVRDLGYHELANNADRDFAACRYFAVSSLGTKRVLPNRRLDTSAIQPIGVECPLFWCLNEVRS